MAQWRLHSVRDPLTATLSAGEKKQLARYLKEEGLGSLAAARKNDELAMQLVRIDDAKGKPAFALYLASFGSGALFEHDKPTLVGNVIQHHFELVDDDRSDLPAQLAKAFTKAEVKRLGLATAIVFGKSPPKGSALPASTGVAEALALPKGSARMTAVSQLASMLFGTKWAPYPKRDPQALSAEQRRFLEATISAGHEVGLVRCGLFSKIEWNARALGKAPAGASDVEITIGKERLPLWRAVSDVASGHRDPAKVLAAFSKLDPTKALAGWQEIARGDAYDLFGAHALTDAESGIPRTPNNVKHRTRLFSWMADANLALGEPGRGAAEALTKTKITLDYRSGYPWAFIAILSLVHHAARAGAVLDPTHDELVARLDGKYGDAFAAPIVKEIEKTLAKDRLAAIATRRAERAARRGT